LGIESLERRDTPTVMLDPISHDLFVDGTANPDRITLDANLYLGQIFVTDNGQPHVFSAASVHSIFVNTYGMDDIVNVERITPGLVFFDVSLGTGNDVLNLAQIPQDLDGIQSDIFVWGQGGTDAVTAFDRNDATPFGYVASQTHLNTAGRLFGGLEFSDIDNVNLNCHNTSSTTVVSGTTAGTTLTVSGGSLNDTVQLGTGDLDRLMGPVNVVGNAGVDSISIQDQMRVASDTYSLGTNSISRARFGGLTYQGVESINLEAQPGGNAFVVSGLPAIGVNIAINGNGGTDSMAGPNVNSTWYLRGNGTGSVYNYSFRDIERLYGGWGIDTFRFAGVGQFDYARVDGGLGVDRLDYSQFPLSANVNLAAGTATQVTAGGVVDIENVTGSELSDTIIGSAISNSLLGLGGNDVMFGGDGFDSMDGGAGHDIMFGQDGNDSMSGGLGRDIMFSGAGADIMDGGADDDILGSGTTTFESNLAGLLDIQSEWISSHSYWDRVWNIRGVSQNSSTWGSRLNGASYLVTQGQSPTVIHPPSAEDQMTGGLMTPTDGNHDWFFGHAAEYLDHEAGEAINA
jgi:Ca2+-binding RTX toxin-like protein